MSRVDFERFVKDRLASLVSFVPGAGLISDNVQDAIEEVAGKVSGFIDRKIQADLFVPDCKALIQRNPIVEPGVEFGAEPGGEIIVL